VQIASLHPLFLCFLTMQLSDVAIALLRKDLKRDGQLQTSPLRPSQLGSLPLMICTPNAALSPSSQLRKDAPKSSLTEHTHNVWHTSLTPYLKTRSANATLSLARGPLTNAISKGGIIKPYTWHCVSSQLFSTHPFSQRCSRGAEARPRTGDTGSGQRLETIVRQHSA
jgi:hypothetical protein